MRGNCSPTITGLEYELDHSPIVKFSANILHNNTLFIQNFPALENIMSIGSFCPNLIIPGTTLGNRDY